MHVAVVRSRAIDPGAIRFAQTLSEGGHDVELLLWDRNASTDDMNGLGFTLTTFRAPAPYDKVSAVLVLPVWWLYELLHLLLSRIDVVHACDFDTLVPAVITKILRRKKLCYTIFDFYASNLPANVPMVLRDFVARLEKFCVGFADVVFLPDESRHDQLDGAKIKSVVYVYNSPADSQHSAGLKDATNPIGATVLYAGILHKSRGIDHLISAISEVQGMALVIAGTGPEEPLVEKAQASLPKKVRYLGQVTHARVLEETEKADVLFASYDPIIPNSQYASPNKLFEAMMCGKPIVVSEGGRMAELVAAEECGLVVRFGDLVGLRNALIELRDNLGLRNRLGRNGRRAYDLRYSGSEMSRRLLAAYEELRGTSGVPNR